MKPSWILGCLLIPGMALPALAQEYAQQWPIVLDDAAAGAHRVPLDAAVYRAARSPGLADVDVVNAGGASVPAQLFASAAAPVGQVRSVSVRWFALPDAGATAADDIATAVERNADGSVRRVETRIGAASAVPRAGSWLVDASALREPIRALSLDWSGDGDIDRAYRIEGSDDLRSWRTLQSRVQLVDLARGGERLRQRRIAVDGQARYLRLLPLDGAGAPQLASVTAELAPRAAPPDRQWLALSGRAVRADGGTHYEYALDGRFPVESIDVQLAGNGTVEWTVYSREDAQAPWRLRVGPWLSYRIGGEDAEDRSAPEDLAGVVRDRQWKLVGGSSLPEAPVLRLGWRPESMVFVAQGEPPYRLVAGSARSARAQAPVARSLDAIRARRGAAWQPSPASLGAATMLAGDDALQPPPRDWTSWLLWSLLALGAALVGGFALSLLRQQRAPAD